MRGNPYYLSTVYKHRPTHKHPVFSRHKPNLGGANKWGGERSGGSVKASCLLL